MQENIRKLTNQELEEIALEVQSHTGLPFLDPVTTRILRFFNNTTLAKENLFDYLKDNIINICIRVTHEVYRNNPNIKKCYDF